MRAPHDTRRQLREIVGWSILSTVATLAKLVVWMDATLAHDAEGGDLELDEDGR